MKIEISTKVTTFAKLEDFSTSQKGIKYLSRSAFETLKKSIIKNGFMLPIVVWRNKNKLNIIDGHQRILTIREMRKEGYEFDRIPYIEITAKDEKDAKMKLLAAASQYGKLNDEALYEFLEMNEIEADHLLETVTMADMETMKFIESYYSDPADDPPAEKPKSYKVTVVFETESEARDFYNAQLERGYNAKIKA